MHRETNSIPQGYRNNPLHSLQHLKHNLRYYSPLWLVLSSSHIIIQFGIHQLQNEISLQLLNYRLIKLDPVTLLPCVVHQIPSPQTISKTLKANACMSKQLIFGSPKSNLSFPLWSCISSCFDLSISSIFTSIQHCSRRLETLFLGFLQACKFAYHFRVWLTLSLLGKSRIHSVKYWASCFEVARRRMPRRQ